MFSSPSMGEASVGDGSILMSSSPSMVEVSVGEVRIVGLVVEDDEDDDFDIGMEV
jgi:hypothetical protein